MIFISNLKICIVIFYRSFKAVLAQLKETKYAIENETNIESHYYVGFSSLLHFVFLRWITEEELRNFEMFHKGDCKKVNCQ